MSKNNDPLTAKKSSLSLFFFLFLLGLAAAGIFVLTILYEREKPQVSMLSDISLIGSGKEIRLAVTDEKSGLREIQVTLRQEDRQVTLLQKNFNRKNFLNNAGPHRHEQSFAVSTGSIGFKDGDATLEVRARDFSWWKWMAGNEAVIKYPVTMDTKPPRITVVNSPRYINGGGSGAVIYRLSEEAVEHGVSIDGHFNPGFPVREGDDRFVAYFGLGYDIDKVDQAMVIAVDRAGNKGMAAFGMIVKEFKIKTDRINVSDNFLKLKMPEFAQNSPEMQGSLLEQYLYVNNEVRKANYQTIVKACSNPIPERLWRGRFKRMDRSTRRSGFADLRTYFYQDEEIDHQVHLGIDLASTRRAEIRAANRGNVVFADYLGIYGNTVILDHGQGVFSLYSHMSQLGVTVGDEIRSNGLLGLSGATGMAGGDHLHFSMLINGLFVNPLEWWDASWLQNNIEDLL